MKTLSCVQVFVTPWTVACTKLLFPWDFLGKSTGVGCHFLLQGIFLTQGSNPGLPYCRQTLYRLSQQGPGEESSRPKLKTPAFCLQVINIHWRVRWLVFSPSKLVLCPGIENWETKNAIIDYLKHTKKKFFLMKQLVWILILFLNTVLKHIIFKVKF